MFTGYLGILQLLSSRPVKELVAQVAAVAAVLLSQLTAARWVAEVRMSALGATMVLTVVSGLHYAWLVSRRVGTPALGSTGAR